MTDKVYIQNPYLKNLQSNILKTEFEDGNYHLILDKTIFYPHLSGGQPRDKGKIDNVEVLDVFERKDEIVHVLDEKIKNENVRLSIDWDHRFDIMQQHTGQHILSMSIDKLFGGKTSGLHIGDEYTSIDLDLKNINPSQVEQIELLTNKIIQSNFPIKSYFQNRDGENLRVVEIEDMDYNHCCGTHLYNTGEVGILKIIKSSNHKKGSRVEFLCGLRALRHYNLIHNNIKDISILMSSKESEAFYKVKNLFETQKDLEKKNRNLKKEIYSLKAEIYFKDRREIQGINYIVKELEDMNIKEASFISSNLIDRENTIQIYSIKDEDTGYFFLSRSDDLNLNLKQVLDEVSQSIIIKAGGNPQSIQGKSSLQVLDRVIQLFYNSIRGKMV